MVFPFRRRTDENSVSIFLGLTEVAGYYSSLRGGLLRKGIDVEFVPLVNHRFGYEQPPSHRLFPQLISSLLALEQRRKPDVVSRAISFTVRYILRVPLFLWAVATFDVFVFSFGFSFFNLMDLPLLRLLGKTIIFQFHGSDSRPPYIDGPFLKGVDAFGAGEMRMLLAKRRQLNRINRYAHFVIDTPTAGHLHTRPFVNWMAIGIPCKSLDRIERAKNGDEQRVRILHSPSDPAIKGTETIRRLVEDLREELEPDGIEIEYVEVTGRLHAEVLDEINRCDIVVDQVYADYGMPGFASEAAAHGRPVVIGGYAACFWKTRQPNGVSLPTHFVMPGEMKEILRRLIVDRHYREESGRVHQQFVVETWEASLVAERYLRLIRGEDLSAWYVDPQEIDYVEGCGASDERVRRVVKSLIERFGPEGLQLTDKPKLVRRFEEFAREGLCAE